MDYFRIMVDVPIRINEKVISVKVPIECETEYNPNTCSYNVIIKEQKSNIAEELTIMWTDEEHWEAD